MNTFHSPRHRCIARRLSILAAGCALMVAGCSKDETSPPPADSAPAVEGASWKVDPQLADQLKNMAHQCKVEATTGVVTCEGGEDRRLVSEFISNKRSKVKSLETFAAALESEDVKERAVAASLLYGSMRANLGTEVTTGSVDQRQARGLVDQLKKLPKPQARQVAPAAVHAAVLAEDEAHLYEVLDSDSSLGAAAYRYLMVHGRLSSFGKIQELAKSTNTALALAALEAPRNMQAWSPKDRASICPWAEKLLPEKRPMVASRAAGLLARCSGAFVDLLLDDGEASVRAGTFTLSKLAAYRDVCSASRRRKGEVTDVQCQRNRALLTSVAKDSKAEARTRAQALSAIAYQWPDDESLRLAASLEKGQPRDLMSVAAKTSERLKKRLAASKTQPSGASSKASPQAAR